jgi:small subunit ribosomal protein S1
MTNEAPQEPTQPLANDPTEPVEAVPELASEPVENFADILSDFERAHARKPEGGGRQLEGRVISLSADQVFLDVGYKMEGALPRSAFGNEDVKPGDVVPVSIKGRNRATGQPSKLRSRRRSPWWVR